MRSDGDLNGTATDHWSRWWWWRWSCAVATKWQSSGAAARWAIECGLTIANEQECVSPRRRRRRVDLTWLDGHYSPHTQPESRVESMQLCGVRLAGHVHSCVYWLRNGIPIQSLLSWVCRKIFNSWAACPEEQNRTEVYVGREKMMIRATVDHSRIE